MNRILGLLALVGIAFVTYQAYKTMSNSKPKKLNREEKE